MNDDTADLVFNPWELLEPGSQAELGWLALHSQPEQAEDRAEEEAER